MTTQSPEMTAAESRLVSELIKPDCQIQVVIPAEIEPKEWAKAFHAVVKALDTIYRKDKFMKPALGRLLLVARANPATYKELGHQTFDAFLEKEIKSRYEWGRSTWFATMSMVDRWPNLTVAEYAEVGPKKFEVLAKAIPKGDEKKSEAVRLLETSKTVTVSELKDLCVERGLSISGDHDGAVLSITCSKAQLQVFNDFFACPEVQAVCQTADKGKILELAIAEVIGEWVNLAQSYAKEAAVMP